MARRRETALRGTISMMDIKRKPTINRRIRAALAKAWPRLRPAEAQAAQYGKEMGLEALQRQWRAGHGGFVPPEVLRALA